jgi:hypothetical protein
MAPMKKIRKAQDGVTRTIDSRQDWEREQKQKRQRDFDRLFKN